MEAAVQAGRGKPMEQIPGVPWYMICCTMAESDTPDEVNTDELLELDSQEERCKIQGLLEHHTSTTEDIIQELLAKLQGLHNQLQPSLSDDHSLNLYKDWTHTPYPDCCLYLSAPNPPNSYCYLMAL